MRRGTNRRRDLQGQLQEVGVDRGVEPEGEAEGEEREVPHLLHQWLL